MYIVALGTRGGFTQNKRGKQKPGSWSPLPHGARQDPKTPQAGLRFLPGALTPAVLPGAALILTVPSPVKEVGAGAKNLTIEDSTGAL